MCSWCDMSNDIIHCQNTQYMNEGGAGFVITKVLSFSCLYGGSSTVDGRNCKHYLRF